MEDRSRAAGVGIRQFHQRFPAENVQRLSRGPLTGSKCKCTQIGDVSCSPNSLFLKQNLFIVPMEVRHFQIEQLLQAG